MFNTPKEFYPTPVKTIEKLLRGIDFKLINTILEPNAGDGAIAEYIRDKYELYSKYSNTSKKYDIDCIEIDQNLQFILQGKNFRVVYDDFLTYETLKNYDLIVMNPPFSNQEKHIKKAINVLSGSGGELRCIVNSEMIKNPYSNIRKEIINILIQNDATIEILQNEFIGARRETEVEIAIIKCKFAKKENSLILNDLKRSAEEKEINYNCTHVVENDFITAIIKQFNFEAAAGVKLIDEYNRLRAFTSSQFNKDDSILTLKITGDKNYSDPEENNLKNEYLKKVRYKYWSALFDNKEFTKLFTDNLRKDFYNKLEELSNYDFNEFNINQLKKQLNDKIVIGVKETILNLFDKFSIEHWWDKNNTNGNIHYYNGWKTNKAHKINKKVIIPLSAFDSYANGFYPTRYNVKNKLSDIEKVFNYLDTGKTEELTLSDILEKAERSGKTKGIITKFFKIDFMKKGTCHLTFLDEELLKKFNIFGSMEKGWLPPSYSKKAYKDMTKEEKQVIDEFDGGEKQYNEVVNNKEYFIYNSNNFLMLK